MESSETHYARQDQAIRFDHQVGTRAEVTHVSMAQFLGGMRRFAGAVNIITVRQDNVSYGLTATSVCSVSAEPPRLLVCVNMKGASFDAIRRRGALAVNTLAVGQENTALRFGGAGDANIDRFETGKWHLSPTFDLPMLEGACCTFECSLCKVIDSGTHALMIADIVHIASPVCAPPLVYHDGTFCGLLEL